MPSRHTDTTDIRDWLRTNRPDLKVQPRGAIGKDALAVYRDEHPADEVRETPDELEADTGETRPGHADEVAPADSGTARWLRRGAPRAQRPRTSHRRVPVDGLLSMAWGALGKLTSTPATLPVGRCMQLQAPAAGMVLDDALRGSIVDRMAQPLARGAKRGEAVFGVIGPPILVAAVCQRPELYDVVRPMLVEALKSWILLAGPKIKKAKEREEKLLAELDGDLTSIDDMIDMLFAPPPATQEPEGESDAPDSARQAA